MTKRLYEVQTRFLSGWYNDWFEDDEHTIPTYFESREEAQAEIDDVIAGTVQAVEMGNMEEPYSQEDYRIRLVKLDDNSFINNKRG